MVNFFENPRKYINKSRQSLTSLGSYIDEIEPLKETTNITYKFNTDKELKDKIRKHRYHYI